MLALLSCGAQFVIRLFEQRLALRNTPTMFRQMHRPIDQDPGELINQDLPDVRAAISLARKDGGLSRQASLLERSTRSGWSTRERALNLPVAEPYGFDIAQAVAPFVDEAFYRLNVSDLAGDEDAAMHYCRKGWRQGRDPSSVFSTNGYLLAYPDVAERGVNPLWHYLTRGRAEGRSPQAAPEPRDPPPQHVDANFYLATNIDVADAQIDPAAHYKRYGRVEGRAANSWFDGEFYRQADQVLATSGVDPLDHYFRVGRAEGRAVYDQRSESFATLHRLRARYECIGGPASMSLLGSGSLVKALQFKLQGRRLVLSFSHDAYTRSVGGTQLLIAEEQARFTAEGVAYLHLAPAVARTHPTRKDHRNPLRATLDGVELGCVDAVSLARTLDQLDASLAPQRLLVCHCILGHDVSDIIVLCTSLRPARAFFWIHDFSSVCEGFTLLRNDLEYCGAPPYDSVGCRICMHGARRRRHQQNISSLFEAISFDVLAPSISSLTIWDAATALPTRSRTVAPHAQIDFDRRRSQIVPPEACGTRTTPVRVAFLGHQASHKGWSGFRRIVRASMYDPSYTFFHFGVEPALPDLPINFVKTCVTIQNRDAMRAALEDHAIDLVLVLSTWPETFSFVTYEAIAAGADVLALEGSGNVADEVLRSGRGVVFADLEAVRDFFTSHRAVEYTRLILKNGNEGGSLEFNGGSARHVSWDIELSDHNVCMQTYDKTASL